MKGVCVSLLPSLPREVEAGHGGARDGRGLVHRRHKSKSPNAPQWLEAIISPKSHNFPKIRQVFRLQTECTRAGVGELAPPPRTGAMRLRGGPGTAPESSNCRVAASPTPGPSPPHCPPVPPSLACTSWRPCCSSASGPGSPAPPAAAARHPPPRRLGITTGDRDRAREGGGGSCVQVARVTGRVTGRVTVHTKTSS